MDKVIEKLRKLPVFVETIMYSGLILFNGHASVISQAKKDEFIKDIESLIAELNAVKDSGTYLEIKQD